VRSFERSTVSSRSDGFATIPDGSGLDPALDPALDPGDATALHVREEPLGWGGRAATDEVTVLGVRPAPRVTPRVTPRGALPSAPPAAQLARGSGPMRSLAVPRSSTAPAYPLVAGTAFRALPSPPRAPAERPIAWGRLFAAIAVMSALVGGLTAKLAYQPRSAPAAPAATAAVGGVAVLPFENRSSDPALREAPAELARVLADELAARSLAPGAARAGEAAPAAVLRGSIADHADGGVHLRVELVRPGGRPVAVIDRRAAPAELPAMLRGGVPAFAGLLGAPARP
jgi:hypothetical protein